MLNSHWKKIASWKQALVTFEFCWNSSNQIQFVGLIGIQLSKMHSETNMDIIYENIQLDTEGKNERKETANGRKLSITAQQSMENFKHGKEKTVRKYFRVWCSQKNCKAHFLFAS